MKEKVVPVRSPSSSAARKVLAQTIRTAVARSAHAPVPSWRLVMARYGRVGLSSPGRVMGSSSRARHHTDRPPSRTPAVSHLTLGWARTASTISPIWVWLITV